MSVKKGMPKASVELAGTRYDLRHDVDAIGEVEVTAQALGLNTGRNSIYDLLDPPYNFREQVVLFLAGVNGAKRFNEQKDLLDIDAAKKIIQDHFNWIRAKEYNIPDWKAAIQRFNEGLSDAARLGVGLVPPSMLKPTEEKTEKP